MKKIQFFAICYFGTGIEVVTLYRLQRNQDFFRIFCTHVPLYFTVLQLSASVAVEYWRAMK